MELMLCSQSHCLLYSFHGPFTVYGQFTQRYLAVPCYSLFAMLLVVTVYFGQKDDEINDDIFLMSPRAMCYR